MLEQDRQVGRVRRVQVMGDAFVERAMSGLDVFSAPLQDRLNERAWGSTQQCESIDLKTHDLCTYTMLAMSGRSTELKGHVRGTLNNDTAAMEIREVLLYSVIYVGVSTATETSRSTHEILNELGIEIKEAH